MKTETPETEQKAETKKTTVKNAASDTVAGLTLDSPTTSGKTAESKASSEGTAGLIGIHQSCGSIDYHAHSLVLKHKVFLCYDRLKDRSLLNSFKEYIHAVDAGRLKLRLDHDFLSPVDAEMTGLHLPLSRTHRFQC